MYGSVKEAEARQHYITYLRTNGHPNLTVDECGLFVSLSDPWHTAGLDGSVHDPRDADHTLGLVEIMNPCSGREETLAEASTSSTFCLERNIDR